ncbi:MAG: protoporphyrinogen/coproporphyrinogen oxidase, partial [Chloroflexota bacterium]
VAVVGAGMAGLAAAHALAKKGLAVTVFEKNSYVGGRIRTDVYEGQRIEGGAQTYFEFYRLTRKLIREVDLAEYETYLPGRTGILRRRKIADISSGPALLLDGHLSFRSKLLLGRLLRRLLAHWRQLDHERLERAHALDTKSVAAFAVEELNQEILAYVFEPVLSGLFYWRSKEVSQAALFVLLRHALFGLRPMTLRCGLSSLPRALAQDLDVRVNHTVGQIGETESGTYRVTGHNGLQEFRCEFDAVICATTAAVVPRLIPSLSSAQKRFFQSIKYSQNVNIAVEVDGNPMAETPSLYVPPAEPHIQTLGAVAQQSHGVISLFSSATSGADLVDEPDGVVSSRLVQDFERALPTANNGDLRPIAELIYRWPRALPILDVGYFERLRAFQRSMPEPDNLLFCGDYLGGAIIEGAVRSGMDAANRLICRL